jgi:hypothetical protein
MNSINNTIHIFFSHFSVHFLIFLVLGVNHRGIVLYDLI